MCIAETHEAVYPFLVVKLQDDRVLAHVSQVAESYRGKNYIKRRIGHRCVAEWMMTYDDFP